MSEDPKRQHGPHPDPPVDDNLDVVDDEGGVASQGPHPDPPVEDDIATQNEVADTGSELSFPTSDPPATWAGPDEA